MTDCHRIAGSTTRLAPPTNANFHHRPVATIGAPPTENTHNTPEEDCQLKEDCQGEKFGNLATLPKEEDCQDLE